MVSTVIPEEQEDSNKVIHTNNFISAQEEQAQSLKSKNNENGSQQIQAYDIFVPLFKPKNQIQDKEFRMDNQTFNLGFSWIFRALFINISKLMYLISKNVIQKNKKIEIQHLPDLKKSEIVENNYFLFEEALLRITQGEKIQGKHAYQMVKQVFKKKFFKCHILIALSLIVRSFSSIIIQKIINSFKNDDLNLAIFYAVILFLILFLNICLSNNAFKYVQIISAQIRSNLVAYLYNRASTLTSFQIKKANIGKLFNLISYDLGALEIMLYFALMIMYIPLLLIISAVILYFRFGSYGILSIVILTLIIPVQLIFGIKQKIQLNMKNKHSDDRIKLINETIESIRLMKMYGWESAFESNIAGVRDKELNCIKKIQILRASDRGNSTSLVLIAAFFPILIVYYKNTADLSSSIIFATLEQLYSLRNILYLTGVGISFLFQIGLILNRFADFLSLKKQSITILEDNQNHIPELFEKQLLIQKKKDLLDKKKGIFLNENPLATRNRKIMKQFELEPEEQKIIDIKNDRFNQKEFKLECPQNGENIAEFSNFTSLWDPNSDAVLKNITWNIKKGNFYGIVGKVGSGKSTLLQVILDEVPHFQGNLKKSGTASYVEQEPYIFSGKFKDNILFGKPYEQNFYNEVIKACSLDQDIDILPNGDETEIGERGINLSGGQKARLSLARAVYSKNDIYLLDDPLSAVDSKVASNIYKNCLNGILKNKTVLLVTHQIHFTKSCNEIIVLEQGRIAHKGTFQDLENILLSMSNQEHFSQNKEQLSLNLTISQQEKKESKQVQSLSQQKQQNFEKDLEKKLKEEKEKKGKLIIQEKDEKFDLSLKTYQTYFRHAQSSYKIFLVLLLYILSEGIYSSFYFTFGSYDQNDNKSQLFYESGILMGCFIVICISKYILTVLITNICNRNLHNQMFSQLTKAPILYFDQTPSGRILNRFSSDIGNTDLMLPFMLFDSIEGPLQLLNICITVGVLNPWFFIIAIFMIFSTIFLLKYNLPLIVQSKQLDLMYKSPIYEYFSSTVQGIIHIRIYQQGKNFFTNMCKILNDSVRTNYAFWSFNRGFAFNQQMSTIIFSLIGIILSIYTSSSSDKLGQSIVYLTQIIDVIASLSRQIPNLDSCMSSVDRAQQICKLPQEDAQIKPLDYKLYNELETAENKQNIIIFKNFQRQSWIKKGNIVFQNVQMKYRKDLDLVLKGCSFSIKGGERVGCVGRTGAGKSSIIQVLFRMVPVEQGSLVMIDDIDIKQIGLNTLRNSMSIIPQMPFVFNGTVRRNLDPLEEYSEDQIWQSLKQTNLEETIKKLPNGLNTDMTNVQSIFSTGQKQLICLARAILKNSKILVLDEATANVDMKTDEFIQEAIQTQFTGSTIFTIAHRLNTIANYDKVIVMDQGVVAEFDEPYKLLVKQIGDLEITSESIFAQMVQNTGYENSQAILKIAQQKYYEIHNQQQDNYNM